MAGDTVGLAAVDLGAELEEALGVPGQGRHGLGGLGRLDGAALLVGFGRGIDGLEPGVLGLATGFGEHVEGEVLAQPRGGIDGLEAHASMGVAGRALEERSMVRDDVGVIAEHADGGGADAMILRLEELLEQRQIL